MPLLGNVMDTEEWQGCWKSNGAEQEDARTNKKGHGNGRVRKKRGPSISLNQIQRIVREYENFETKSAKAIARQFTVSENSVRTTLRMLRDEGFYGRTIEEKKRMFLKQSRA